MTTPHSAHLEELQAGRRQHVAMLRHGRSHHDVGAACRYRFATDDRPLQWRYVRADARHLAASQLAELPDALQQDRELWLVLDAMLRHQHREVSLALVAADVD